MSNTVLKSDCTYSLWRGFKRPESYCKHLYVWPLIQRSISVKFSTFQRFIFSGYPLVFYLIANRVRQGQGEETLKTVMNRVRLLEILKVFPRDIKPCFDVQILVYLWQRNLLTCSESHQLHFSLLPILFSYSWHCITINVNLLHKEPSTS